MSDYVNKIITKDKEKYNINDSRIPSPTPEDKGKVLGVNRKGELEFIKLGTGSGDAVGLVEGTIEEFEATEPLKTIRPYMFNELTDLVTINLNGVIKDVGQKAINHCDNLGVLNLGKIDGVVGDYAFSNLIKVSEFSIDPESNITDLGKDCFSGLGMERNSAERFYIDLRNSTFKNFQGFGTATIEASYASGTDEIVREAIPGVGLFNTEVRLPSTVETLREELISSGSSGWATMSGSGGILNSSEKVDVYFTGKDKQIVLNSTEMLPTDEQSHIYIPFDIYGTYKLSTNWAALDNLYGYFEEGEIPAGQLLPVWDNEGFEVYWYSDKNKENKITKSNGNEMYAYETGLRLFSKVILSQSNDCGISIFDDQGNSYRSGDLVRVGTQLTIKALPNSQSDTLTLFTVNDQDYTDQGQATFTLTEQNVYIVAVCNVANIPNYLYGERAYNNYLNKDVYAIRGNSYDMPSEITVDSKYLVNRNGRKEYMDFEVFSTIKQYRYDWGGNYSNITKVTLADGFKALSDYAFYDLWGLSLVNLPSTMEFISYQAFSNCSKLQTITGTENITRIGGGAFRYCSNLTNVSFPELSYVDEYVFGGCTGLTELNFPKVTFLSSEAFRNCTNVSIVSFPLCVRVGSYAFDSCTNLTEIDFPECERLDQYAFGGTGISSFNLPKVEIISTSAFANCPISGTLSDTNLPNIKRLDGFNGTLLESVEFLHLSSLSGYGTFASCYNLTTVNLPECSFLGSYIFSSCINLENINIPHLQKVYGSPFMGCDKLTTLSFSELTTVDNYGFGDMYALQSIDLPVCTLLNSGAFRNDSVLTTVNIPNCEQIGSYAFYSCSSLKTLSFPKCEYIEGIYTFYSCRMLESLYLLTSKVPTLKEDDMYGTVNAFDYTPITDSSYLGYYGSIYVRASLAEAFKTASNWSDFADRIVGLTDEQINNL